MRRRDPTQRVTILERYNSADRRSDYSHSLAIHFATDGLRKMDVLGDCARAAGPSHSMLMCFADKDALHVKVDTAWVLPPTGDNVAPENVRGYALWSVLHREAVRLGVVFVYDCDVTGIDTVPNGSGIMVVKARNGQTYTADLLLACDGSKSAVRAALAQSCTPIHACCSENTVVLYV
jgi:2-polyprenyl-6-methoxyphenol hydroxylase-like FAD-dependent oxidoreductase